MGRSIQDLRSTIRLTTGEVRMTPQLEVEYLSHKSRLVLQQRRLAVGLAVLLWSVFLYWDIAHHDRFEHFNILLTLRLVGIVILSAFFLSAFTKHFLSERFAESVLLVATTLAWAGILAMMLVSPAPNNYLDYYGGLPLMYVYLFSFLWIRVSKALALGVVLAIAFNLVEWWMYDEWARYVATRPGDREFYEANVQYYGELRESYQRPFQYYWGTASFYITSFLVLGAIVCYQLERSLRINFLRERELAAETKQRESQSVELINLKEQQLRQANESNERKSGFLAAAAHDIRQPLMAVGATLEALETWVARGDLEASTQYVRESRIALRALRSTLNGVLEISQLESGFVVPAYSRFDICELLQEACKPAAVLANKKGVTFRPLRIPDGPVFVRSDRVLLGRIISNLSGNAVKYTTAGADRRAAVLLGLVRLGSRVRVDVYDTGIGIPRQHHDLIFRPFFQIGNQERDREKGLGLGLSIVAQIAEILDDHRLDFASSPGRGSRFSIEVPTSEDQSQPDVPAEPTNDAGDNSAATLQGSYVLVVEDDLLVRKALNAALESWGMLVESCRSLSDVSRFLDGCERNPDLILTDFALPESQTGYDVIRSVRQFCGRDVPAVILTGELNFHRCEDIQVSSIVSKPAEMKALKSILASCLKRPAQTAT